MTSETPSSAFEHDPLPDSTTHLRLLHILRGDFGQHVECEVSPWPIDDAPPYYAISYTWGDPADTTEITVNGKPLVVRRNCEYVLQQAFATKASRYYWVDAICIAQTSIQERNHQVGIMGKIYAGAKHVFACVGSHSDDSEWLMATVGQKQSILEDINRWSQWQRSYNSIDPFHFPQYYEGRWRAWRKVRCLFTMHTAGQIRMSRAFFAFMKRPYFTRVWVLQELHLATKLSYCCGADVQPGEYFRALDPLVEYWIKRRREYWTRRSTYLRSTLERYQERILPKRMLTNNPSQESWRDVMYFYPTIEMSRICLQLGVSAQKQDLGKILGLLRDFYCEDARDHLYGILSLIEWPPGQGPTPDYTKDNFEVAKHVLSVWPRERYDPSFIDQCFRLFELFDVTLELASVRHAIALRSNVIPQADLRLQGSRASQIGNVPTQWSGIQINDEDLICESIDERRHPGPNLCYMEQERDEGFSWIRISSKVTVCAPVDTKVGDWCLIATGHSPPGDTCKLILRESKDGEYLVVGLALADIPGRCRDIRLGKGLRLETSFVGFMDPEDMMVLAWTLHPFAAKQEVSDKEIEELVNMRVCGWTNSSYFQKVSDKPPANSSLCRAGWT